MLDRLRLLSLGVVLAGCGGTITLDEGNGATSSGAGGASTTTAASGSSGSFAESSSSASVGASSSSSGAGGGGCGTFTVAIVQEDAPTYHYTSSCAAQPWNENATTANGWYSASPVDPSLGLELYGCNSAATGSDGITVEVGNVVMGPGTFQGGAVQLTLGGQTWTNEAGKVVYPVEVTVSSEDGTAIVGTFSATVVSPSQGMQMLTGSFDVCEGPIFAPP